MEGKVLYLHYVGFPDAFLLNSMVFGLKAAGCLRDKVRNYPGFNILAGRAKALYPFVPATHYVLAGFTPAASPEDQHENIQLGELVLCIPTHGSSSWCSGVAAIAVSLGCYWQVASRNVFRSISYTVFTIYCVAACMSYWAGWSGVSVIEHGCKQHLCVEPSAPDTLLAKASAFSSCAIDYSWQS